MSICLQHFFLFPLLDRGQNTVYILLDSIVFPKLLFQLAVFGIQPVLFGSKPLVVCFELGGIRELTRYACGFQCLCRCFKEDDFTFMPAQIFFLVAGFLVLIVQRS